jgi:hypothetical protein
MTVSGVIEVANHCCPLLDTLHMVKYSLGILKITTRLHLFTKSTPLLVPTSNI